MAFGVLVYLAYGRRNSVLAGIRSPAAPISETRGRHRR
ncbi:hypothetical protein FHR32_002850 [Streptosporangium album]|uniref:Uncharacterized protein n=1 Tax=Streptosporangium album TaxID=47479 RepID=A0A7W7RUQ4_9ACTN|nr:hypothetical protein [Streptosporangium album]